MGKLIRGDLHNAPQFSFADFESMAGAARQRAHAQALEILRSADIRARREAEQIRRQAQHTGVSEGRKLGMDAIRREAWNQVLKDSGQRIGQLLEALQSSLSQLEAGKRRLLAESETGMIRLAIEIARRVCKRVVLNAPESALANAEKLIELIRHHHDAQLRLSPDDLAVIREIAPAWIHQAEQQHHVTIIADESVERGGCLLTSAAGRIDAGIQTQIDRIAEALLGEVDSISGSDIGATAPSRFTAVDPDEAPAPRAEEITQS